MSGTPEPGREVYYTYGNQGEVELPAHARLRIYLPGTGSSHQRWVEIAATDEGGVELRGAGALVTVLNASNAMRVDIADRYERREDSSKRDLAEGVFDRLAATGATFDDMCELARELKLPESERFRKVNDWVKTVAKTLARRLAK
jgi:hypothetical protein